MRGVQYLLLAIWVGWVGWVLAFQMKPPFGEPGPGIGAFMTLLGGGAGLAAWAYWLNSRDKE